METEEKRSTEDTFFLGKRPWSKIKDSVLGSYMPPYLSKVARLGRRIILIDCFAGPGKFSDGTPGSPLIMCGMAEKHASGKCIAVFVNKEKAHHEKLTKILEKYIEKKIAFPILGDGRALLDEVQKIIQNDTLFVYLDPFGLKGCEFEAIKSLLRRGNQASTEILVNLSMPTFHRLAAKRAVAEGRSEHPRIKSFHKTLDGVFGGDYWRKYAFDDKYLPEEKEQLVMKEYRALLQEHLPHSGSCPVQESSGSRVKYFITFCSRHPDAILLMNDIMCGAYNQYIHEASLKDVPLLAPAMPDWKTQREKTQTILKRVVLEEVQKQPGRTRIQVWASVVTNHFMLFRAGEFKDIVQELVDAGKIESPTPRSRKRLNDDCALNPGKNADE